MKANKLIEFMQDFAPEDIAEEWDNVGFQIGEDYLEVNKLVLALDLDKELVGYAKENNCQMIISHHPFIFTGLKSVTNRTYEGQVIIDLIKNGIGFYASHTNLDQVKDGVSWQLAKKLDLKNMEILDAIDESKKQGYGIIGDLDKIKVLDLIELIKEKVDIASLTVFGEIDDISVSKIGVMGGSGASYIEMAKASGAELLITGDVKYHDGQLASKNGLIVIDAGHYHTEKHVLYSLRKELMGLNKDLEILIYEKPSPLYKIY